VIFVVSPEDDSFEIREFLQVQGHPFVDRIRPLTYEEIMARKELPLGSYIFTAIDQLSPTEREITALCWQALSNASSQITLINHPQQVLSRSELLETCFQLKRNSFRVFRATQFASCTRFPVFLRLERQHLGSLSGLLYSKRALLRALAKVLAQGYRLRDTIIVEYCDTADSAGFFQKYSAFIVGDIIVPNSIVHSDDWVTKWAVRSAEPELVRQEVEYVETNPHADWLRQTFSIAKIGYGRIDYGIKDSVPQVWEINTNPTITRRIWDTDPVREQARRVRAAVRDRFLRGFEEAFAAIDTPLDPAQTIPIDISKSYLRKLQAEKRLRLRVAKRRASVSRATRSVSALLRRLHLR
jgi:hypothetical protein